MSLAGLVLSMMPGVRFPWNLRNYLVFHRWFWIRDNLGQELYHSNNDLASRSDDVNNMRGLHRAMQLHFNPSEAARMRRMNEVEYYRERMAIAVDWIRLHPSRFAALTAQRALEFWFPNAALAAPSAYSIPAITLLSLPGLTDGGAKPTRYVVYRARIRALSAGLLPGPIQHALPLSDPVVVPAARGLLPGPCCPVGPGPLPASATPSP